MCCGSAEVYDGADDSPCYLSSMALATLNERKNSNGGKTAVTLTSRFPFQMRERPVMHLEPVSMVTTSDSALINCDKCGVQPV